MRATRLVGTDAGWRRKEGPGLKSVTGEGALQRVDRIERAPLAVGGGRERRVLRELALHCLEDGGAVRVERTVDGGHRLLQRSAGVAPAGSKAVESAALEAASLST
eukprot:scaffold76002_cov60-Phaeocystis_antarctica.AAC.2